MEMVDVMFKLPEPMLDAGLEIAKADDVTLGQVLRQLLSAEIQRTTRNAKTPYRADELLLAPLRALLAADLATASDWNDLQSRLKKRGYAFREAGGGLALHTHPDGARLCKASELGHSYGALMRRFKAPFPGHSHTHLVEKYLSSTSDDSTFDVFEKFDT